MNKSNPLVVIRCFVYNHEPYLRTCLDGFIMQQTTFPYVAIVHDDCSTDKSADIIREYADKYPHIIKPLYEKENLYRSNPQLLRQVVEKAQNATGAKYVAICEGDDYWTDPYKLQKQVDFLESHPDYSVCFHNCSYYYVSSNQAKNAKDYSALIPKGDTGVDITADDYFKNRLPGQPLTMLYRRSSYSEEWIQIYKDFRDTHFIYLLLRQGKGYFMNFVGGVYNLHTGGQSAGATKVQVCNTYFVELDLYKYNSDDHVLVDYVCRTMLWVLDTFKDQKLYHHFLKAEYDMLSVSLRLFINVNKKRIVRLIKRK